MRGSLPLGEDPLTNAMNKMTALREEEDERIAGFFEAIRDLVLAGPSTTTLTKSITEKKAPTLKGLAGTWKNSDGLECVVAGNQCTFNGRITSKIVVQDNVPILNG